MDGAAGSGVREVRLCLVHRDFGATQCPDDLRYAWVHRVSADVQAAARFDAAALGRNALQAQMLVRVGRLRETPGFDPAQWYVVWYDEFGGAADIRRVRTLPEVMAEAEARGWPPGPGG